MHGKLTVILPVRNGEEYLEECLDSILNQTYKDFVVLAIDDGSTDRTLNILKKYQDTDNRIEIKYFDKNINGNSSGPINEGLKLVQTPLITWISSDDYLAHENVFKMQLEALQAHPECAMVSSSYRQIGNCPHNVIEAEAYCTPEMVHASNCIGASFLFKKEVFDKIGYMRTDLMGVDDWEYWIRVVDSFKIWKLSDIGICWRSHGKNMTSINTVACLKNLRRVRNEK